MQSWRHGRWFRKFTVRFRPIRKELENSIYNDTDNQTKCKLEEKLSWHTNVSASKVQVFLNFKEAQNSNIFVAILNSTRQPGSIFGTSFHPRDFVWIASEEFFNCHSGLWLLLSHTFLNQTCSKLQNDSIEDNKGIITCFCWPCEGCQVSYRSFSFPPILSRTGWHKINMAWLPRQSQYDNLQVASL